MLTPPLLSNLTSLQVFTLTLTLSLKGRGDKKFAAVCFPLKGRAAVFKVKGGAMSSPILYYPEALHSGWSPA
ncbi:hypothetical protein, partial [Cedecea sp. NFIX57]|uniref:hypothetical protein n=1 Tax=Cedecea sp. NFIX57 TaxID=1566286 RepID=UPI001C38AB9C